MIADDQKPEVAQKPPNPEELVKDYLWRFLQRKLGVSSAVIIFLIVVSAWAFHSEIGQLIAYLDARIVE